MTTRTNGPQAGSHDSHDRLLIAARAAGDLTGPELARSASLLATCPDCRALHDELRAIAAATRRLPPSARPATLDFRIPPGRAAELVRGGLWRRLLRPFGRSGSGAIRPLAAAFTTLGLAGLMLAALPTLQLGSTGTFLSTTAESGAPAGASAPTLRPEAEVPADATVAPGQTDRDTAGGEATGDSGGLGPIVPSADDKGAVPSSGTNVEGSGDAGAQGGSDRGQGGNDGVTDVSGGPTPLMLLSLALLGAGLGLFLVRQVALRLR
jgi:hypothetical protein